MRVGRGWGGQSTSQRAMRFMQAMEKKKSVIKLQIREEWFAMGMWSFVAGIFCRIAYVQVCTQLQNLLKLENSRAPVKSAIFAIFAKFAKNWRNAKFADQEQEKNHQTTDFSQFSQIW